MQIFSKNTQNNSKSVRIRQRFFSQERICSSDGTLHVLVVLLKKMLHTLIRKACEKGVIYCAHIMTCKPKHAHFFGGKFMLNASEGYNLRRIDERTHILNIDIHTI